MCAAASQTPTMRMQKTQYMAASHLDGLFPLLTIAPSYVTPWLAQPAPNLLSQLVDENVPISHKSLLASHSKTQGSPLHPPPTTWLLCMLISPRNLLLPQPTTCLVRLLPCSPAKAITCPAYRHTFIRPFSLPTFVHLTESRGVSIHNCAMQPCQSSNTPAPRTKRAKELEPQNLTNADACPNSSPTCRDLESTMQIIS
ncbi:hypothetical protein IWX49DRAFT_269230 [Phyllosticta citricarpa]|uniref:Uncharacterized protein n=1 Tax=Phyllosticta citricarpa TaxID=55181 RepID=A0ABR1L3D2_9PEZI